MSSTLPRPSRRLKPYKTWYRDYYQRRTFHDRPYIDTLRDNHIELDPVTALLQDTDAAGPSWEVKKVQRFLTQPTPLNKSRIWLHRRTEGSGPMNSDGNVEHDSKWLTTSSLPSIIPPPRVHLSQENSNRRYLTFVPDLTPQIVKVLVEGASSSQAQSLRAAVRGHVTGITSIAVTSVTHAGFPTFLLELHLPYVMLLPSAVVAEHEWGKSKLLWSSKDFLPLDVGDDPDNRCYSILTAHTSVVIAGAHHFDWHGYAFGNTGPRDPAAEEYEEQDDAYNYDGSDVTPDDIYHAEAEDFFAAGGCPSTSVPSKAIMDPRIYYLRAVQHRLSVVVQSHEHLVRTLEEGFDDWVRHRDLRSDTQLQRSIECIGDMAQLVHKLHHRFDVMIKTWSRFSCARGDILYFQDHQDSDAEDALHKIEESFEKMADLVAALENLLKTCEKWSKRCEDQLQLGRHGMRRIMTEAAEKVAESARSSQISAEEMTRSTRINIQLLMVTTAVVIALQYFCSERALFSFERSPRMFWASICVLVLSLLLLTHLLHALDQFKKPLFERVMGKWKKAITPEPVSLPDA